MLSRARGERGAPGTQQRSYDLQQLITLRMWNSGLWCLTSLLAVSHLCFQFALLYFFFFLMEDPGVCCTVSQIIFSPFYLELSLAKQGYEQLYRWASQGEWRYKASNQVLATCSTVEMPLQQISVVPARETASNGRSSMGRNKEKSKEVEVRGRFRFDTVGQVCLLWPVFGCSAGCSVL